MTAARLIELLAQHIVKHGNMEVRIQTSPGIFEPAARCWLRGAVVRDDGLPSYPIVVVGPA